MNLTDGTILCGRKYFDGMMYTPPGHWLKVFVPLTFSSVGSGGNNHAVEHYQKTQYPLAVKLGTITPEGADVYSYAEDDMVQDPHLTKHLKHFGIDMTSMTKVRGGETM